MVDIETEDLLTLEDARSDSLVLKLYKTRPSHSTIWRWTAQGYHGVKLEIARSPRGVMTSRQAIVRFIERITTGTAPDQATPTQAKKSHERAKALLNAAGF